MSALAPTMQAFFTDRLARQRRASQHTIAAYRDTFRLLLAFAQQRTGKAPSALHICVLTDAEDPHVRGVVAADDAGVDRPHLGPLFGKVSLPWARCRRR